MRSAAPLRTLPLAIACIASSLFSAAPLAAQGAWSDEFDRPGLLGRVFALGEYQGQLVAGGLGVQADGHMLGLTARFDGAHWQPMGSGITSGSPYQVRSFVEFQGALVAGGYFCCAGSQSVDSVARWDGAQWTPLGAGIDGTVYALAEYHGELYAAGSFDTAGGTAASNVARWDGTQWRTVGGGIGAGFGVEVTALVVGPDDRLYASGEFTSAGGNSAHNVAAWNGASWSPLGGGLPGPLNGIVHDLVWYQGLLYAGGNFDLVAGGGPHEKVARWNGSAWTAAGNFPDSAIGTSVNALEVFGAHLYAGGSIVDANGVAVERFARFDGSQWSYAGGVSGSSVSSSIWDLSVYGGLLVVGGEFSLVGLAFGVGQPTVAESIASFDGATWDSVGTGLGFDAAVRDATLWNGRVVAVGNFSEAGSQFVSGPVMLEGGDWVALGHSSGSIDALGEFQGDLVIAGDFTSIDGQAIEGVARYDGTQWSGFGPGWGGAAIAEYQGQLYVGGLGGVKRWNGASWESFAPQIFGQVLALHVHAGVLYIGGSLFSDQNLLSWNGATQQTLGGGTNGSVNAFASFEGDLIVGGEFTNAGGVAANRLARWNGSSFSAFPGITGTVVDALTIYRGELCASGNLIVPGLPPNKYIARWDGAAWQAFGGGIQGQPGALVADDAAGALYAGGIIQQADGLPSWYIARWDDEPFAVGTPYCFGDDSGTPCPCGNVDASGAAGCANSSGAGARLSAAGSASVSAGDLRLELSSAAPGQPALFFQGDLRTNGGAGLLLGDGLRCAGQGVVRIEIVLVGPDGSASSSAPIASTGGVSAGETKHYQLWYRDPTLSPCGFQHNLSNGLSVDWGR